MNRSPLQAVGTGLLAGSMAGLAVVEMGAFLAGSYGAIYAFFLCPLVAVPVGACTMVWAARSGTSAKE